MSDDPARWKEAEDGPEQVRDLIRRSVVAPMPADVRARLSAKLPGAAPPPASAVKAAVASPVALGALVAAGLVVAVALGAWRARATPEAHVLHPPPKTAIRSSASSSVLPEPTAAPSAPPSASTSRPRSSLPAVASAGDTLSEESVLVGRARANLVSNPAVALAAVDEHGRRFPRGELAMEREYLRVSALHRLGRDDEARARGLRFLATYPSSPNAPAVRNLLAEIERRNP